METYPVLIFDGHCNFCNKSVDLILQREKTHDLRFTANQNEAGKQILEAHGMGAAANSSLYLLENGVLYRESAAALRVARRMRFPWNLLYAFIIVPPFIRNAVYRWIARNRYRWFGHADHCRIPSPEERARFLA